MKLWCRKLAVLLLFLALPLQGVATTVYALSCLSGGDDRHAAHSQAHGHDYGSPHDHDGDTGTNDSANFCCNVVSSGMATVPTSNTQATAPIFESAIPSLSKLFIPEQPQRPPLA